MKDFALELGSRGRLTPVDVVYYGTALLLLSFLAAPMYQVMNDNASSLGAGSGYLFQLVFPAMVITIVSVVYLTGASGGGQ